MSDDEVSHSDTSSESNQDNSGNTFIQDVAVDTYGHVTNMVNSTISAIAASIVTAGTFATDASYGFKNDVVVAGELWPKGDIEMRGSTKRLNYVVAGDTKISIWGQDNGSIYCGGVISSETFSIQTNGAIRINWRDASPGVVGGQAQIYSMDDSGTIEAYVMDGAGNETKFSPHNSKGEWEFFSRNVKTGRTVRVNMEKLVRTVERLSGESLMEEYFEEVRQ